MFNEQGLAALIKLGQERKDSKLLCAVIFALGNMAATETHARQVEQAGGLAWVQQQLASPDAEIVRATWGSLSVFAKYDFARQKIVEAGAIKVRGRDRPFYTQIWHCARHQCTDSLSQNTELLIPA